MTTNSKSTVNLSGVTSQLLGVLFVGLKLTGYISWPWIWVLSPFWIPVAIVITVLFLIGLVYVLTLLVETIKN